MSTVAAWGTGLLIVQCMVCLDSIEFEVLPQACSQSMILHCPRLQSAKGAAALSSNLLYPHLSRLLYPGQVTRKFTGGHKGAVHSLLTLMAANGEVSNQL